MNIGPLVEYIDSMTREGLVTLTPWGPGGGGGGNPFNDLILNMGLTGMSTPKKIEMKLKVSFLDADIDLSYGQEEMKNVADLEIDGQITPAWIFYVLFFVDKAIIARNLAVSLANKKSIVFGEIDGKPVYVPKRKIISITFSLMGSTITVMHNEQDLSGITDTVTMREYFASLVSLSIINTVFQFLANSSTNIQAH